MGSLTTVVSVLGWKQLLHSQNILLRYASIIYNRPPPNVFGLHAWAPAGGHSGGGFRPGKFSAGARLFVRGQPFCARGQTRPQSPDKCSPVVSSVFRRTPNHRWPRRRISATSNKCRLPERADLLAEHWANVQSPNATTSICCGLVGQQVVQPAVQPVADIRFDMDLSYNLLWIWAVHSACGTACCTTNRSKWGCGLT